MDNEHTLDIPGSTVVRWENDWKDREGYVSRFEWGDGPWQEEPDRVEWRTSGRALPRMVLRGPHGNWCGYVGVPEGHWAYGGSWDSKGIEELDVHGGITYGNECGGNICHVPQEGEPDHVWWIGFDCGHAFDLSPALSSLVGRRGCETYRDLAYVVSETEKLARQLELSAIE